MKTQLTAARGTVALAVALTAALATAAPTLSTEYRYASQLNEYFVRGDAAVSESAQFRKGLRLAAWDAPEQDDATRVAVATAAYFFQVPLAARSVAIEVAYQADPAATNPQVAGFLFVRNKAIEDQFAGQNKDGERPIEEPGFFGNTYLLPANQQRVSVTLPTENHVIDGVLEVHLSAGAGQVFDAQYVQVTAFGVEVLVPIQYVEPAAYVPNPYDYSYYYYYAGPNYYPYGSYYACFQLTSFDPIFWHQWSLRRAAYFTYHPWCYRPAHYSHWPFIAIHRPAFIVKPHIDRYRDDWYRRCFRVDPAHVRSDDFDHLIRRRRDFLPPERVVDQQRVARQLVDQGHAFERELRDRFGDPGTSWRRNPTEVTQAIQSLRRRDDFIQNTKAWTSVQTTRRPRLVGTSQPYTSTAVPLELHNQTSPGFPGSTSGQVRRDIPQPKTPIVPRPLELQPLQPRTLSPSATRTPDTPGSTALQLPDARDQTLRERFQQLLQGNRTTGPIPDKGGARNIQESTKPAWRRGDKGDGETLRTLPDVNLEGTRQPQIGPFRRLEQTAPGATTPAIGPTAPGNPHSPPPPPKGWDEPKRKPRSELAPTPSRPALTASLPAPAVTVTAPITPPPLPSQVTPQVVAQDAANRRFSNRAPATARSETPSVRIQGERQPTFASANQWQAQPAFSASPAPRLSPAPTVSQPPAPLPAVRSRDRNADVGSANPSSSPTVPQDTEGRGRGRGRGR
ncbi:MAG TPA: hypothetical protein P5532_04145 [Planctomycetota bacterium]|nr:hypothetical protein [Planctomycetota bacterium]